MLKILILSDDYLPNSTRVHAKMLHELAIQLSDIGHKVTVLTPGDANQKNIRVIDFLDNIEIWRFKSNPTRGVSKIKRAINESMLPIRAYIALKKHISTQSFDICINYSPTIFFGPLTWLLNKRGTFIYLILRDFFPQWVIDQGIIKEKSLISQYFKLFETLNYNASDCIAVQSPGNLALFKNKYPKKKNTTVLYNWAKAVSTPKNDIITKESLGLNNKTVLFYGGNIGHAQDMMNIIRLAKKLKPYTHAHIVLMGQGDEYDLVKEKIVDWSLDNITLMPSVSQSEYIRIVAGMDIGLFSLSAKHSSHNIPGKLLGYMAESLPILGSVNKGNDK
ncbi:glycosyltransferase family 4 protein [Psychrobacter lutiphocae]|uniref:glycosyltransferase family 4 protein n=1 Tax=Psychrobacter lutiphocae TaxID=540500 RepID=UPI00037F9A55|nr:glycosyltransferase family 4 protein [Psychrobacter lutiphocae]